MAQPKKSSMAVLCLVLVVFAFSITTLEANDFLVGGKEDLWRIPSSPSEFSRWAHKNRFEVGDYLVWKYDAKSDSVLEVTGEAYTVCNTSSFVNKYDNGNTRVRLDRSGTFFFISGAEGHCNKGEKLEVVVASHNHRDKGEAPSPAPAMALAPAPAPSLSAKAHSGSSALAAASAVVFVGLFLGAGSLVHSVLV